MFIDIKLFAFNRIRHLDVAFTNYNSKDRLALGLYQITYSHWEHWDTSETQS